MPADTDIAAAARRVAEHIHEREEPDLADLLALLPILDAVAAGRGKVGRVERVSRALCVASGHADPDQPYADAPIWRKFAAQVGFVLALADAERAAARAASDDAAHEMVRGIYEATGGATPALRESYERYRAWEAEKAPRG